MIAFRPSIVDYLATLENPVGVFRTLGEVVVERDVWGEVAFRAGNSAAVFTYFRDGERRLLKLYVRPNPYLREIYDYVASVRSPVLPDVRLLRDELFVLSPSGWSGWVDVVEGRWIEGETLASQESSVKSQESGCAKKTATSVAPKTHNSSLPNSFASLRRSIAAAEWAHGDLKPENIIVRGDGTMMLVDLDAMWIPAFAGRRAVELGTPPWSAPGRTAELFDGTIDDYPLARIAEWLGRS